MRKFFLENMGLKVAAVLLSIVLWIFVTSRGQSEISLDVPLEFKNIPSGLELVNHSAKTVALNIRGHERFIKNVKSSDIRVAVDLSKAKKGEGLYYINREDIKVPGAISVTHISPSSVKIVTEETTSKTVRVEPVIIGDPEKGYRIRSVEVTPQTILVEGVSSEIIRIKTIKTEPLDVTGISETFTQNLRIDFTGKNIRSKKSEVAVRVVIGATQQ
jgi:YbbR domain-containing protein